MLAAKPVKNVPMSPESGGAGVVWQAVNLGLWMRKEKMHPTNDGTSNRKKAYVAPTITIHGDVDKITENAATGSSDGVMAGHTMGG